MKRPREPTPGDCCGSGCTRCVWDIYYDELAQFEDFIANGGTQDVDSNSSDEEETVTYIGSVVVKYMDSLASLSSSSGIASHWEKYEMKSRAFLPIEKVDLVKCSENHFSPDKPGICVVNLHVSGGSRTMLPGDVVEVLVPNSRGTQYADDVERLCRVLNLDPDTWCQLHRSPFVPEDSFPPWLPLEQPLTVAQLLAFYVDISSSSYLLHRAFFESLLRIYRDSIVTSASRLGERISPDSEMVSLLEACASSERGPLLLRNLSNKSSPLCYPSLADVLEAFSFIKLPLDRLLEVTGPLQTRKYSVARWIPPTSCASPLQVCMREVCARRPVKLSPDATSSDSQRMAEVFNKVAQRALLAEGDFFYGHTSHALCASARSTLCNDFLTNSRRAYVSFSLFGTSNFAQQLQGCCNSICDGAHATPRRGPLCLVGCGTGIAPLVAAVTQLVLRRISSASSDAAYPCWVFYGARTKNELLYDDTLRHALSIGAISKYEQALSREVNQGVDFKHVTDLLRHNRNPVSDALRDAGHMFVCGPAKALRSVRSLLQCDLLAESGDDESVQEQRLLMLEAHGRLNFDVWSTGDIFG